MEWEEIKDNIWMQFPWTAQVRRAWQQARAVTHRSDGAARVAAWGVGWRVAGLGRLVPLLSQDCCTHDMYVAVVHAFYSNVRTVHVHIGLPSHRPCSSSLGPPSHTGAHLQWRSRDTCKPNTYCKCSFFSLILQNLNSSPSPSPSRQELVALEVPEEERPRVGWDGG